MEYNEREGDLIASALAGEFDVITHGCNCFCLQKSGIAVPMSQTFYTDKFRMESGHWKGDYNKLGTIDYKVVRVNPVEKKILNPLHDLGDLAENIICKDLYVVNSYTQYRPGVATPPYPHPVDYDAMRMCFRKINHVFKGLDMGIPRIGCHLGGGDWKIVSKMIKEEFTNMKNVTVLIK